MNSVDGRSKSGSWKFSPSSPPVRSLSCEHSVMKADATASVIIAKKMAFTRRLARPMPSASTALSASAATKPMPSDAQSGPSRVDAMAMP